MKTAIITAWLTSWLVLHGTAFAADDQSAREPSPPSAGHKLEGPAAPSSELPSGATVRNDEASLAYFVASKARIPADLTIFRPNANMPEASAKFLAEQISKVPTTGLMGVMPRLVVHPCADGCSGGDFEKAVARLVAGYESYSKAARSDGMVEYRGVLPVEVRWFGTRTLFVPMSQNQFGISLIYEGKLVSLGKSTTQTSVAKLAETMGERLAYEMLFRAGAGLRPRFLHALETESALARAAAGAAVINVGVRSLVGNSDTRSRVEPVDPIKHARLLPAVDGIEPGEVRPVHEMRFVLDL